MNAKTNDSSAVRIDPVPFRSSVPRRRPPGAFYRWIVTGVLVAVFVLLSAGAWFVLTARQVVIDIDPAPQDVSIAGGLPAVRMGSYYLIHPGTYAIEARRPCYRTLKKPLAVSDQKRQTVTFRMQPLSGRITFDIRPAGNSAVSVRNLQVLIDGRKFNLATDAEAMLAPGKRRVEIRSENYQPLTSVVAVEGCGRRQTLRFSLQPDWAQVRLNSKPTGKAVWVDGRPAGQTPLTTVLKSGHHAVEIRAPGYQTWHAALDITAGKPIAMPDVRLQLAAAKVYLSSVPAGANVLVGDRYAGATPLALSLAPGREHTIRLSRVGYENALRRVKLSAGEEKKLRVRLTARQGTLELAVAPVDAELVIDGQSRGAVVPKISLAAGPHCLEIRAKDYLPFQTTVTVRSGYPRKVKVSLQKRGQALMIAAPNDYKLKLIRPTGTFTMGSSRREQGRLSNETLRRIRLKRPFYLGLREVTNREFKEFKAVHRPGRFGGRSLDGANLPVVQVTWQAAALFCNWLSLRESLNPVYVVQGGRLVAQAPVGTGYRLPTEAEWAYSARLGEAAQRPRYPWGNRFPPKVVSANYADESARRLLTTYLAGYNDGYPVAAPVGSFAASRAVRYGGQRRGVVPRRLLHLSLPAGPGGHRPHRAGPRPPACDPGLQLERRHHHHSEAGLPRLWPQAPAGSWFPYRALRQVSLLR